jgi:hypothetical protein
MLNPKTQRQEIARLTQECAYAHWHRMLFARFLAENNALMHEEGYPVTLEELDEWAVTWGLGSRWEAAARCAVKLLPQIFGSHDHVLAVVLSRASQSGLEDELARLDEVIFKTRDALGWVYQFWQSSSKEAIDASEKKIGADELPAITQLFTEPYMVDFLLQNTLGAWWFGRHGKDDLIAEMKYLRFDHSGAPIAGTFAAWPKTTRALRLLDPCCGSGHFLVAAFEMLVKFRQAEEGLQLGTAIDAVLMENLRGLELDRRCVQIAAFAVALRAWTLLGHFRPLYGVDIACTGLGIRTQKAAWIALAGGNERFEAGLSRLYDTFSLAPVLGSLIQPQVRRDPILEASFEDLQPLLEEALQDEQPDDDAHHELAITASGLTKAASILAGSYHLVCTNPPFLKSGRHCQEVADHLVRNFGDGKADLATAFMLRIEKFLEAGGTMSVVLPQNWTFLTSYRPLRIHTMRTSSLHIIARLGPGAFATISGEVVQPSLVISTRAAPSNTQIATIDVLSIKGPSVKASALLQGGVICNYISQTDQSKNPDHRILLEAAGAGSLLALSALAGKGSTTGDSHRFLRCFWEYPNIPVKATRWLDSPSGDPWSGRSLVLNVPLDDANLLKIPGLMLRGQNIWGRTGIAVSKMGQLEAFWYRGEVFDDNVGAIVPIDGDNLLPIAAYIESADYRKEIRQVDQALKVTAATLVKVPFDLERWKKVAAEMYPNGLPSPTSNDPTQWLFRGEVPSSAAPLQVAMARLLGYRWPDQPMDAVLDPLADSDGIVCIPAVRNEAPAAERLLTLLATAYGDAWSPNLLATLLGEDGGAGLSLEAWLRDRFFEQHFARFAQRPFVWQVWDGLRDGFSALLHYHRLDRALLGRLIHAELGDWIQRQEAAVAQKVSGAGERLAAARALRAKLLDIEKGEKPFDVFVRWKPIEAQPLGWEPDLDDGVRQNIRPWVKAGVLRKQPKIKWDKPDRGTDPPSAPWYDAWTEKGQRRNDHHLTLAEKQRVRDEVTGVRR